MNKAQLVASISDKSGLTKKQSEEALVGGDKVQLVGFGTFETRQRAERQGKNPRNPEEVIHIPASIAPVFKAGKSLKDLVNGR